MAKGPLKGTPRQGKRLTSKSIAAMRKKGDSQKQPPKGYMEVLLPIKVLEYRAEGKGFYNRICQDFLGGWRPRHPVTQKPMDADGLVAWAIGELAGDDQLEAMAARSLHEIGRVAYADIRKFYDEHGHLRPIHTLDDDAAAALSGVDQTTKTIVGSEDADLSITEKTSKIRMNDKLAANRLILDAAGKLKQQVEHSGKVEVTKIERVIVDPKDTDR